MSILQFYIDGDRQDRISGSVGWQKKSYTISTSGSHAGRAKSKTQIAK